MYYRRKLIFGILEEFGGKLNMTNFQKILFLTTRFQTKKSFDFVPYKFGCFSFQANQDLHTMCKLKSLKKEISNSAEYWTLVNGKNFFNELKKEDQCAIKQVRKEVDSFSQRELIKYTYLKYPYYAIKSQIAKELLSKEQLLKIESQRRSLDEPAFFTIGYEGISLETYLNKLIINDVKLLCDVRKNSLSMKYGFSKNQLKNACESIDIKFVHIPELGIDSAKRNNLETISDYNILFDEYEKITLSNNKEFIAQLAQLAFDYNRIAITCFEKEPCMCHRSRLAKSLCELPAWNIPQTNI